MDKQKLKALFQMYTPSQEQQEVMDSVRKQAYQLAGLMMMNSPDSVVQDEAIYALKTALMYFNLALLAGQHD